MPSPFPGMDPYLEAHWCWGDVHHRLITYMADALQPHLRPNYLARMEERVYVIHPPHTMYPDVLVIGNKVQEVQTAYALPQLVQASSSTDVDTPIVLTQGAVEHREPRVEIIHTASQELITLIEVLSPANKVAGKGHQQYVHKQQEILGSTVNLVEIDLLSQGLLTVALSQAEVDALRPHRYRINVCRAAGWGQREVYPIALAQRLPRIAVPLREGDADVRLDLPVVFAQCYDNGGYAELVDYQAAPPVPLSEEEVAWADKLLREKDLRV